MRRKLAGQLVDESADDVFSGAIRQDRVILCDTPGCRAEATERVGSHERYCRRCFEQRYGRVALSRK